MKLLSTLTLGALLVAGSAFAATTPTSAPTAMPAPAAQPAAKHPSIAHCEKEAKAKKLTGEEEKAFVKECHAGKQPG